MLASNALPTFIGSFWVGMTLCSSYVARTSTKANRVIRFLALETAFYFALAAGNLLGGQLLKRRSWIGGAEIRNFSATFILGIVCSILSVFWTIFRIEIDPVCNEDKGMIIDADADEEVDADPIALANRDENANEDSDAKEMGGANEEEGGAKKGPIVYFFRFLFIEVLNPKRVLDSFKLVIAKRESGIRNQIIFLMIAHIAINLEQIGMWKIMFSFTQRLYFWNFEMYSFISMISAINGPIVTMIAIPFLSKVCKLSDIEMCIVGTLSLILATLSIGSILTPIGMYLRIMFGSMANSANISIRSKMSKIIAKNESTKIFAAMTTIEVLCPFIAAVIYTNIFNATMASYPSLIIQLSTLTLFIPFVIFILIDLKYERIFN